MYPMSTGDSHELAVTTTEEGISDHKPTTQVSKHHSSTKSRRYNLVIPEDLYDQIQEIADTHAEPMVSTLKRFIKLGLLVESLRNNPDVKFLIREGDTEREVLIV